MSFQSECVHRQPPGKEIYRKQKISVFEVDGKDHKVIKANMKEMVAMCKEIVTVYFS